MWEQRPSLDRAIRDLDMFSRVNEGAAGAEDRAVPAKERHSPFGCETGGVISPEVVLLRLVDCVIAVGIMSHSEYPGQGLHVVRLRVARQSVRFVGVTLRLEAGDVLHIGHRQKVAQLGGVDNVFGFDGLFFTGRHVE